MTQKGQKVTRIDQGLQSIARLNIQQPEAVTDLCLHGNSLHELQGLRAFQSLEALNLSSNYLSFESVEQELHHLFRLVDLNLASNQLSWLGTTPALSRLKRLNLAHNFLSSLKAFHPAAASIAQSDQVTPVSAESADEPQQHVMLEELDLQDNLLQNVNELRALESLSKLKQLHLQGGSPGNGMCMQPGYRLAVASLLPQLEVLDGSNLIVERLQLAKDPHAAIAYLLPTTETNRAQHASAGLSGVQSAHNFEAPVHDFNAAAAASPYHKADGAHQVQAERTWQALATIDQQQAFASALFQQEAALRQGTRPQMPAAFGMANTDGCMPSCDLGLWSSAWRHLQPKSSQAAGHLLLAEAPVHMQMREHQHPTGQSPHASTFPPPGGIPFSLPSHSQVDSQQFLSHSRLDQPKSAGNCMAWEQGCEHPPLSSQLHAHPVNHLIQNGQHSNSQGSPATHTSAPSPAQHAKQGTSSEYQPQAPAQPCNKCNGHADAANNHEGAADGIQDAVRPAKADAACQAGDAGLAIDRLQQDADR